MSLTISPPGSNAERSRAYNRSLVLSHIQRSGPSGRAEIARASGLSIQAVSNIIADLVADGWLREAGKRTGGRGLPSVIYAIEAGAGLAFGVEIRPDAVLCALIDLQGRVVHTGRAALSSADPDHVVPEVRALYAQAVARTRVPASRILGAGVVLPGPFGETGLSGLSTELPDWEHDDPGALLSDALGLAVTVENDANAAAMAERLVGVATGLSTYAYVYFGTGIGLGFVSNGGLLRGAFGNAGEIGHMPVPAEGGVRPLEAVASRMALAARLRGSGQAAETVDDLDRLFTARHPALEAWLDVATPALGHAVHVLENLLDPETVIFGGALPPALLQHLTDSIQLSDASVANRADRQRPRLMAGATGRMSATLGAAALVIDQALTPSLTLPA
ncbi:ROK family transcriptional regulator [Pelagovum pacificum]|uniref:ROK family transcriptional regulator n=1 Tax=Pelagovum pacificum TaxID=2588711 RepID=A0A5C5G8C3_9RHOB|nr:ROK family transcriptional regulator [Pelagovum pacificum]QQA41697.1 ROK family transcriptional regulator [Pelagovum pacificum]TNY30974.1 ROK family transcriptional regulator [Pelagovum pacificum]